MTLDEIIEGCRRGDDQARRELYELLARGMFGLVRRYVRDEAVAEDLLHDGFVTLFTKIGDYRGEGSFEGWCRRIFVNTVLSSFRRKNPLNRAEDVESVALNRSTEPTAIGDMSAGEIMACMEELPVGYRTIFNLHAVEEYSYAEIAGMLDIDQVTVRSQFMRARMKLIEIMKKRRVYDDR